MPLWFHFTTVNKVELPTFFIPPLGDFNLSKICP
jgi:hypothetical protein